MSASSVTIPNYKGIVEGFTNTPCATSLLCVDSEDRFKNYVDERNALPPSSALPFGTINNSPYNFTISRNESIVNGKPSRIFVSEANFELAIPNVNIRTNRIRIASTDFGGNDLNTIITLGEGFYKPSQLATAMQNAIRAQDPSGIYGLGVFTMTYGISGTGAGAVEMPIFQYATNTSTYISFQDLSGSEYTFGPRSKQLFDLLGFGDYNRAGQENGRGGTTFALWTKFIDIACPQLTAVQNLKDTMTEPSARSVLCRLYLNDSSTPTNVSPSSSAFAPAGTQPGIFYRQFSFPKAIQYIPTLPIGGALTFICYDDSGFPLSETVGLNTVAVPYRSNWSITLLITEN
jgi:hypothetical protein